MLEPTRPAQYTLRWECVCVCMWEREWVRELSFVLSPSFPCCCQGPLRNVNVPFCQSRSQSAKTRTTTQKVTLSFTQPLIKQTELWSPSCHCSSLCPSLTHLFVSLPHSLSPYLHHSSLNPSVSSSTSLLLFPLLIWVPPSASLCSISLYLPHLAPPPPLLPRICFLWLLAISCYFNTHMSYLLYIFSAARDYNSWAGGELLSWCRRTRKTPNLNIWSVFLSCSWLRWVSWTALLTLLSWDFVGFYHRGCIKTMDIGLKGSALNLHSFLWPAGDDSSVCTKKSVCIGSDATAPMISNLSWFLSILQMSYSKRKENNNNCQNCCFDWVCRVFGFDLLPKPKDIPLNMVRYKDGNEHLWKKQPISEDIWKPGELLLENTRKQNIKKWRRS